MDIETSEAIEGVRGDLRDLDVRLSRRIDGLSDRVDGLSGRVDGLSGRVDGLSGRVDGLSDRVDGLSDRVDGLGAEMAHMREDLQREFRDGLAENRRHAEVLFEAVRDDIRIVAEGVAVLTAKVDALNGRGH